MKIDFEMVGAPVAQGRAKATTIGGHVRMYDPARSREWKTLVGWTARQHCPAEPLEGPLSLAVFVHLAIPQSWSKKKQQQAREGVLRPISRPDLSNYIKGIEDACNGILWSDDSQIVTYVSCGKWYSDRPRIHVVVDTL